MKAWEADKAWSDKFIDEIKRIVGPLLLTPSPLEEDQNQASDLKVLKATGLTIACRVRKPGFSDHQSYRHQFTIRSFRESGAKTELEKITDGWADWMFYGHSDAAEKSFCLWYLIDLSAWRAHLIRNKETIIKGNCSNRDGTYFSWFDIRSFKGPPYLLIASSLEYEPPF